MLNRLTLTIFSIWITVATYGSCAQQAPSVETTSCTPESFDQGSCTITCTVNHTSTLDSCSWTYFTQHDTAYVTIYDGVQLNRSDYIYTSSLTLDDYNAGIYECTFSFSNSEYPSAIIKISTAVNGSDLYENCAEDHDCKTLHATCTDDNHYQQKVCQCTGQYNITYTTFGETVSCLKLQPEGGHCYSYLECDWPTESYWCTNNRCTCIGNVTKVKVDGTEKEMCIKPTLIYEDCIYDEQCELAIEHSYCYYYGNVYGYCFCDDHYLVTSTFEWPLSWYCKYGFSGGAIAGIVLATVFGLFIIGITIFYFLKKSK